MEVQRRLMQLVRRPTDNMRQLQRQPVFPRKLTDRRDKFNNLAFQHRLFALHHALQPKWFYCVMGLHSTGRYNYCLVAESRC